MLMQEASEATFDFAFVDADKPSYIQYHEQLIKLVKIGGIIAYDNTLYGGYVVSEEIEMHERSTVNRKAIIQFNNYIASDPRVEISQVPIGDGVTLCRRIIA